MRYWLGVILTMQYVLLPAPVSGKQEQAAVTKSDLVVYDEESLINDYLINPRNPFISQMPKIRQVKKKPPPPVKKVEKKKEVVATVAPLDMAKVSKEFKLSGFVWGSEQPQAIINGQVVGVGETVKTAKITFIESKGVGILYMEQDVLLTMGDK